MKDVASEVDLLLYEFAGLCSLWAHGERTHEEVMALHEKIVQLVKNTQGIKK
jgi:hypothetical protein